MGSPWGRLTIFDDFAKNASHNLIVKIDLILLNGWNGRRVSFIFFVCFVPSLEESRGLFFWSSSFLCQEFYNRYLFTFSCSHSLISSMFFARWAGRKFWCTWKLFPSALRLKPPIHFDAAKVITFHCGLRIFPPFFSLTLHLPPVIMVISH